MEMKVEKSRKWFVFNSANAEQNKQRGEPQHLRVSELVKCCIFPSPRSAVETDFGQLIERKSVDCY